MKEIGNVISSHVSYFVQTAAIIHDHYVWLKTMDVVSQIGNRRQCGQLSGGAERPVGAAFRGWWSAKGCFPILVDERPRVWPPLGGRSSARTWTPWWRVISSVNPCGRHWASEWPSAWCSSTWVADGCLSARPRTIPRRNGWTSKPRTLPCGSRTKDWIVDSSFMIVTPSFLHPSTRCLKPTTARSSKHRSKFPWQMPSPNRGSAPSSVNAWITFSASASNIWITSCKPTPAIIMTSGRISRLATCRWARRASLRLAPLPAKSGPGADGSFLGDFSVIMSEKPRNSREKRGVPDKSGPLWKLGFGPHQPHHYFRTHPHLNKSPDSSGLLALSGQWDAKPDLFTLAVNQL